MGRWDCMVYSPHRLVAFIDFFRGFFMYIVAKYITVPWIPMGKGMERKINNYQLYRIICFVRNLKELYHLERIDGDRNCH